MSRLLPTLRRIQYVQERAWSSREPEPRPRRPFSLEGHSGQSSFEGVRARGPVDLQGGAPAARVEATSVTTRARLDHGATVPPLAALRFGRDPWASLVLQVLLLRASGPAQAPARQQDTFTPASRTR